MTVAAHGMAEVPWCPREGLAYSHWQQGATLQSAGSSRTCWGLVRVLAECGGADRRPRTCVHVKGAVGRLSPGQTRAAGFLRDPVFWNPQLRQYHQAHTTNPLGSSPTGRPPSCSVPRASATEKTSCSLQRGCLQEF